MFEGCDGPVSNVWSLHSSNCLLPSFVRCLSCLLTTQLCRGLLTVVKVGGGGCLDDLGEARLQDLLWEKACPDCVSDHCMDARFGCNESSPSPSPSSQMCRSGDVSRSFETNSGLASTEGRVRPTVLRETREEPFEGPLPNLVVDSCSPLFLKDCVSMNSKDVVDAADSQTLSEWGTFRQRVELNTFVHRPDDICLAKS